jgi:hypothetical protein
MFKSTIINHEGRGEDISSFSAGKILSGSAFREKGEG